MLRVIRMHILTGGMPNSIHRSVSARDNLAWGVDDRADAVAGAIIEQQTPSVGASAVNADNRTRADGRVLNRSWSIGRPVGKM